MNLVRLGHYFTPRGSGDGEIEGACQTALVCGIDSTEGSATDVVNIHVWRKDGMSLGPREGVAVEAPGDGQASFHLSGDCPWNR